MDLLSRLPKNCKLQPCPFCQVNILPFVSTLGEMVIVENDGENHVLACPERAGNLLVWWERIYRECTCYDVLLLNVVLDNEVMAIRRQPLQFEFF